MQDENRAAARSAVSNQPSGLLLSPRFPIFRNVYQESTACRSTVCRTSVGRYRTRTAAEPTTACGGNREARLGPRSDFSRPRQGAAEKSANATRQGRAPQLQLLQECLPRKHRLPEHRLQNLGSCSTGQEQCTSEPFVKTKAGYHRSGGILPFSHLGWSFGWRYGILGSTNRNLKGENSCIR